MDTDDEDRTRCDYCRQPVPDEAIVEEYDGVTYRFCSVACRDALDESERVFTEYHAHRRVDPGVSVFDAALPQGMPRNSFVLLSAQAGTRESALQAELVWRTLQRGEPAVIVSFLEPPISVVETFVTLDWNVFPYLQRGQLRILDCFTYRVDDVDRSHDRMNDWNRHLREVAAPATEEVRDPSDTGELENKLDGILEDADMVDRGLVMIDSLTEFGSLLQPVQAYDFVKNVRSDVCKGRFVPVFAGATYAGEAGEFPHDLEYIVDGIVDMELNNSIVEDTLLKRLRVRKMNGVLAISEWSAYEYTSDRGLVGFDPDEEMETAESGETDADGESPDSDAEDAESGDDVADDDGSGGGGGTRADPADEGTPVEGSPPVADSGEDDRED